jgi:predicted PurR-regulated permease PerM
MLRWALIIVFVAFAWIVLSYIAKVLAPVLAALGIAYLLNPVLERLVRSGMSRGVGAAFLLVSFLTLIIGGIVAAIPAVADQITDFAHDLPRLMTNLQIWLHDHFRVELPSDWKQYLNKENVEHTLGSGAVQHIATAALGGAFALLAVFAEFLLVPVFAFYFLVDWPNLLRRIEHMIPPRKRHSVREIVREIDRVVAGWVRGQGIVTSILAVLYAIGFSIVGIPLSVPIGLLVGALTVIPFVGTFVGAGIAALVTIANGRIELLVWVALVILILHLLEAGVLTPKIVGHRVGLSETGALFAVVAGGKLLGFVGVVLAVPIAATTAVLVRFAVRYYEHTEFFGRESDADIVITPAMAMIMPGVRVDIAGFTPEGRAEDWEIEPELGEAGMSVRENKEELAAPPAQTEDPRVTEPSRPTSGAEGKEEP